MTSNPKLRAGRKHRKTKNYFSKRIGRECRLVYRISCNKCPRLLSNYKALRCGAIGGRCLKEVGTYFKVRRVILMKFQNFVIVFS